MVSSGTIVLIVALSLWGLAVGLLSRRLRRSGAEAAYALLAAVALALGHTMGHGR